MRVEKTIKLYNDFEKEIFEGDVISVTTFKNCYLGKLIKIKNNALVMEISETEMRSIAYSDIKSLI